MHIKKLFVFLGLLGLLGLTGCSTIISEYISGQQSFSYEHIASSDELIRLGFQKSNYCLKQDEACISYLTAEPLTDKSKLDYKVTIDAFGEEETIQLHLMRKNTGFYRGEVILIHGFRMTKEFMINSALYFRFLGFTVLIPDLLGHGESGGEIGFGVKDSQILDNLLVHLSSSKEYPILVVGNSMGAVAATHLAMKNKRVSGLILQAPMTRFDSASVNYINSYSPFMASFLSDQIIREGAVDALNNADVLLSQTDIKPILSSLKIPALILTSVDDPVAPYAYYEPSQSQEVTVTSIENRSHPGMAVIGQLDSDHIQQWLNLEANKAFQRTSR
jgi:pimeloyl-ACP methyl ester carboxylesterase